MRQDGMGWDRREWNGIEQNRRYDCMARNNTGIIVWETFTSAIYIFFMYMCALSYYVK